MKSPKELKSLGLFRIYINDLIVLFIKRFYEHEHPFEEKEY